MAASVEIRIPNLTQVERKLGRELFMPHLAWLLTQAALLAEREARQGAPKDTSALARSITHEVKPLSARVYSPLQYAIVMEEGRRPGAAMPPPQALLGWMRRHGIPASMAFVLARAIGRRGIKGRFFLKKAMDSVERSLPNLMSEMMRRIGTSWSE